MERISFRCRNVTTVSVAAERRRRRESRAETRCAIYAADSIRDSIRIVTPDSIQKLETAKPPTRYSRQPQREAQEFEFVFSNVTQQCLSF